MTVNKVSINTLDRDEWIEVGEAVLVELTCISEDGIGPICVAANADGISIFYEGPNGTKLLRLVLSGDDLVIDSGVSG